jgi:hypothetical protein
MSNENKGPRPSDMPQAKTPEARTVQGRYAQLCRKWCPGEWQDK